MKRFILAALPPLLYLFTCLFSAFPFLGQADFRASVAAPELSESPAAHRTVTAQTLAAQTDEPDQDYACILRDDVYFYADKSERKGLFLLPKTYFVKLLSVNADYCQVEYGSLNAPTKPLIGYCKTEALTFVDYTPTTPYFLQTFDVTYKLDGLTGAPFLTEVTKTCAYYGNYVVGSTVYCYVLQDGKYGYVPKPDAFYVPENREYYDRLQPNEKDEETETEQPKKQSSGNPIQTAILILLCVLIPVLAALILKPSRAPVFDPEDT